MRLPSSLKNDPRALAVEILNRVDGERSFAEPRLDAVLTAGHPAAEADRGLLTFLVYGTLRMRGYLDFVVDHFYTGKPDALEPGIRNILRVALYQLRFAGKIPAYAAVDEAVNLARRLFRGREKLVNAVLRNALRGMSDLKLPSLEADPAGHIAVVHSHPRWIVERWLEAFGVGETLALCRADNEIPPLALRVNTLKTTREAILGRLRDARPAGYSPDGILLAKPPEAPREMREVAEGLLQVQDEAAQLVSRLLDPQRGERILDLCSGAGGKTAHLAALMGNEGDLVATDIQPGKLRSLMSSAQRLGFSVTTAVADAADASTTAALGLFDRVLVDAPCSGLGTLRRNPEIRWHLDAQTLDGFPPQQERILSNAAACVKKGGRLLYGTCSVMPGENDGVVETFLQKRPDFIAAGAPAGFPAGVLDSKKYLRTFPHRHGTDGFFGARLVRR